MDSTERVCAHTHTHIHTDSLTHTQTLLFIGTRFSNLSTRSGKIDGTTIDSTEQ